MTYDFSKQPDYLSRQMFLDGKVTIQRFEDVAYPRIEKFEQNARGYFWVPEEFTLVKDKIDFKESGKAIRHIFTSNLLRQTALDSIQGRGPTQVFTPVVSVPELELLMANWGFFEGNIHSRSYSHIIRNIYGVPKDEFNKIHDTAEIVNMAASVGKYYDDLHVMNSRVASNAYYKAKIEELGLWSLLTAGANQVLDMLIKLPTEQEHIKAIWLALNASYALEAIRFMVSFATSLGMVENKLFIGNGNIITSILQDEMLHTDWTAYIINQVVKDDPRFARAKIECKDEVAQLYRAVIEEEKGWAQYLFREGVVIGLNAEILSSFVDYTSASRLKDIGVKYAELYPTLDVPKSSPLPWFNNHTDTSKKQTALQENESTSYVIGAMSGAVTYDDLPEL